MNARPSRERRAGRSITSRGGGGLFFNQEGEEKRPYFLLDTPPKEQGFAFFSPLFSAEGGKPQLVWQVPRQSHFSCTFTRRYNWHGQSAGHGLERKKGRKHIQGRRKSDFRTSIRARSSRKEPYGEGYFPGDQRADDAGKRRGRRAISNLPKEKVRGRRDCVGSTTRRLSREKGGGGFGGRGGMLFRRRKKIHQATTVSPTAGREKEKRNAIVFNTLRKKEKGKEERQAPPDLVTGFWRAYLGSSFPGSAEGILRGVVHS